MQRETNKPLGSKTAKQLVVVVVLFFGLIVALAAQPEKSISDLPGGSEAMPELAITPIALKTRNQSYQLAVDSSQFQVAELKRLPLDVASRIDLFSEIKIVNQSSTKLDLLQGEVLVKAIYGDHDQIHHSALIGDKIVRKGQGLADGRTIAEVTPEGVKITDAQ
ncbi:MAG: hypothetical protein WBD20_15895 [Pirellulaceae bacterium]